MDWIDAEITYPRVCDTVLLCLSDGSISTGYLQRRRPKIMWEIDNKESNHLEVKYWRRIPEIPEILHKKIMENYEWKNG